MDHLEQASIAVTHEYDAALIHNRLEVSAFVLLLTFSVGRIITMVLAQEARTTLYKGTMPRIICSWVSQYCSVGHKAYPGNCKACQEYFCSSAEYQCVIYMTTLSRALPPVHLRWSVSWKSPCEPIDFDRIRHIKCWLGRQGSCSVVSEIMMCMEFVQWHGL